MSLTFIAVTGIVVGFLCLVIGFFMDEPAAQAAPKARRASRPARKKVIVPHRKAA